MYEIGYSLCGEWIQFDMSYSSSGPWLKSNSCYNLSGSGTQVWLELQFEW